MSIDPNKADVLVSKIDETHMHIDAEDHIAYEIREHFTIDVPGARFMPAYKKGWDGKLRLFNARTRKLYIGLLSDLIEFLQGMDYQFVVDKRLKTDEELSETKLQRYIDSLNLPYEIRDYQKAALAIAISKKRGVLLSPTGSGKSLIIYSILRYFDDRKILLIVPTLSLTTQMYSDFRDYSKKDSSWNVEDFVHVITGGVDKDAPEVITITLENDEQITILGNQYIKVLNSNEKKLASELTEHDEIDDEWIHQYRRN